MKMFFIASDTPHRVCRFHDRVMELHESKVEQVIEHLWNNRQVVCSIPAQISCEYIFTQNSFASHDSV